MVTHYMLRTQAGKWVFSGKNTRFVTALDVIKCLKQVKKPSVFCLTCATVNELPSNISTMGRSALLIYKMSVGNMNEFLYLW